LFPFEVCIIEKQYKKYTTKKRSKRCYEDKIICDTEKKIEVVKIRKCYVNILYEKHNTIL